MAISRVGVGDGSPFRAVVSRACPSRARREGLYGVRSGGKSSGGRGKVVLLKFTEASLEFRMSVSVRISAPL